MSPERQYESFSLIRRLIGRAYPFTDKDVVREYFTKLTGLYKNLNYAPWNSPEYKSLLQQIEELEQQALAGPTETAGSMSNGKVDRLTSATEAREAAYARRCIGGVPTGR